ncbi:MAG: hypothetical protein AB7V77_02605 [Candidatus Woesearchaeota archaeon]
MVKEFSEAIKELESSKEYEKFSKENPSYTLAHGFIQLNKDFSEKSPWQIGFYSKEKDNLAIFELNPIKLLDFENAFKEEGIIQELTNLKSFVSTKQILEHLNEHITKKYSSQIPNSFLMIVQVIDGQQIYNITTITQAFMMINTRFDAKTSEIILDEIRSVLDLRNGNI